MELADRMIATNRRMAAVLREKGYEVTYSEFAAGHDWSHWRVSLAQALTTLLPPSSGESEGSRATAPPPRRAGR